MVNPGKGIFKCFGCGKGGDSVRFLMEHEHYSYPEALKYLGKKYGITVEEEEQTPEQIAQMNEREALYHVSAFAQKYFSEILWNDETGRSVGLSYFKERDLSEASIQKFQLGFCLEKWDAFTNEALKNGYSKEYLVKTGLSILKEKNESENTEERLYDRFRGRVMFPIHNLSGRIIGFGGRILSAEKTKTQAKYVNSPESDIYKKSQVLYGIYFAKTAIINKDCAYLVEGYTDVISMHQNGIENVVASSGTSLTVDQIKLISRYTKNITILYDGDPAGIKASLRGIDMILEQGMNVRIVLFPEGDDPDSFARKHRTEEIENFIETNATDFIKFKTNLLMKDVTDPLKKAGLIQEIMQSIALIANEITRSVYVKECSRMMDIPEDVLNKELKKIFRANFKKKHGEAAQDLPENNEPAPPQEIVPEDSVPLIESEPQEKEIIRILLLHGHRMTTQKFLDENNQEHDIQINITKYLTDEIRNDEMDFKHPEMKIIFDVFCEYANRNEVPDLRVLLGSEQKEVRDLAVEIISTPYDLSENWMNKNIYVPTEQEERKMDEVVHESLYAFKLKYAEMLIKEVRQQMKDTADPADQSLLLVRVKQLQDWRANLCKSLGRIITK